MTTIKGACPVTVLQLNTVKNTCLWEPVILAALINERKYMYTLMVHGLVTLLYCQTITGKKNNEEKQHEQQQKNNVLNQICLIPAQKVEHR